MAIIPSPSHKNFDFLIVGGGIIGLTVARELLLRGHQSIAILEKEPELGLHASGRNSGVLHAGFYYASDSLKAKLCAKGSKQMFDYAQAHQIPVLKTGKVVVATTPEVIPQMQVLLDRAKANGIALERIDLRQLRDLEPEAHSFDSALFSPNTAVIDSKFVMKKLSEDLIQQGVLILKNQEVQQVDREFKSVTTRTDKFGFGHLVNCAGLHADRIAHLFGVGENFCILPFKGIYWKLTPESALRFKGSIYPVPDLRVPFLGVHVTKNIHGEVYLGPTAIPAFGRENYSIFKGIEPLEGAKILTRLARMILKNTQGMRGSVGEEMGRYSRNNFLHAAQGVAPGLQQSDLISQNKIGLRAQLFDTKAARLEMDFLIEKGPQSTHVLNAISPAFSASMAFSEVIVDAIAGPHNRKG
jgi:L-2-hydroxyglutarate oxidase LhgO